MFEPKKQCSKCREWKSEIHDFETRYKAKAKQPYVYSYCNDCRALQKKEAYIARGPEVSRRYCKTWRTKRKHVMLCRQIRWRAKKKGVAYDLDDHLVELGERMYKGVCELTGLPFNFSADTHSDWNSPSIDRIKPHLGYVYSNVRIICHGLNAAIGSWGEEQTAILMQAWLEQRKAA